MAGPGEYSDEDDLTPACSWFLICRRLETGKVAPRFITAYPLEA